MSRTTACAQTDSDRKRLDNTITNIFGHLLVALHSDYDWLIVWRDEVWKLGGIDGDFDGSRDAGLSCNERGFFERQHHLMDRRWGDLEEALHISLGG